MNILLLFFLAVGCVLVLTANINPVQASVEAVEDIELDPISYYELFGVAKEDCDDKKLMKKIYRKKALEFHPDKTVRHEDETDDAFAMRKRLNELTFVKLAHAYEILCDPILRNRYDYLVAQNILDYKEQDWNSMENERYHGRTFHGQDAQRVFEEAEEREVYAFIFSFALSGLVACLPSYYAWKAKQAKKVKMVVPTSDLKEVHFYDFHLPCLHPRV